LLSRKAANLPLAHAEARRDDEPDEEPQAASVDRAEPGEQQQRRHLQQHDDETVMAPKQDRGRLHADLQIVLAIGHCVVGVVGHDPAQVRQHQHRDLGPGDLVAHGGIGHRDTPGERHAKDRLRHADPALAERVQRCQQRRRHRQRQCQRVLQRTQQTEGDE
jgi:hypothetical protein